MQHGAAVATVKTGHRGGCRAARSAIGRYVCGRGVRGRWTGRRAACATGGGAAWTGVAARRARRPGSAPTAAPAAAASPAAGPPVATAVELDSPRDPPLPAEEQAPRPAAGHRAAEHRAAGPAHRPSACSPPTASRRRPTAPRRCSPSSSPTSGWPPSPWSSRSPSPSLGVLFFVTLSYLEVIQLYTKAGGSYVVARDNFGPKVAQVAAVALLIDYTVTVAVQTSAGTAALTSAFPALGRSAHRRDHRGGGARSSSTATSGASARPGKFFAFPTYFFIVSLGPGGHRRRLREGGPRAPCTPMPLPPAHQLVDGRDRHAGLRAAHGASPSSSCCARSPTAARRSPGSRPSPTAWRASADPTARNARIDPGRHELDPRLPRPRGHPARPLDPRGALRRRAPRRSSPRRSSYVLGTGPVGQVPLLRGPVGHRAHPLHRRQHQLQRLPLPGQLRGRGLRTCPGS